MRHLAILPVLVLLLSLSCCQAQTGNMVDVPTLQAELAKGDLQLVDVRTPQEWSTGHIEGARHIDWFSDDFKAEVGKLDRKKPVRLYCAAGGRSEEARELLREMGFTDVLDLDGGMGAWKKAGAPVAK
ncbi:MAG: rhodanese-like domain-containing protein [Flavobacteriales bacterium]|nr:rhodanese-like domain-containing protein [Flavobacteriales bacterium]